MNAETVLEGTVVREDFRCNRFGFGFGSTPMALSQGSL